MGLLNFALNIITLPIDVVKDVLTLGGELTEHEGTYTGRRVDKIMEDVGYEN